MSTAQLLVLDAADDVAVALVDLAAGASVTVAAGDALVIGKRPVPRGHKVALRRVADGQQVVKYGQVIGVAVGDIEPGDHVHSHNLRFAPHEAASLAGAAAVELPTSERSRTFQGYRRADGRVGTRNYVGILTSVNCSATTARMIADRVAPLLHDFPHVDGVVALTHGSGCGLILDSEGGQVLTRTLRGYASHPNFGALLVVGLGCEVLQVDDLMAGAVLPSDTLVETLTIQAEGGIRATVAAGVELVRGMLPALDERRRTPEPISELVLGLNCGGSDGYSGITANPALGVASDLLVGAGGSSVLAEVPEVFGAESLLFARATSQAVRDKLQAKLDWWQDYTARSGGSLDNNPSPGNKAGGLTTILEKSLGAVAKAGRAPLCDVLDYAQLIPAGGLFLMDTPGYDPVSVTGLIGGGATIVVFTTGRGSVIGSRPAPLVKVATNTELYLRMTDDMDVDAGTIVSAGASVDEVGRQIFERIIAVASGEVTASEELGVGQEEFVPWHIGAVT